MAFKTSRVELSCMLLSSSSSCGRLVKDYWPSLMLLKPASHAKVLISDWTQISIGQKKNLTQDSLVWHRSAHTETFRTFFPILRENQASLARNILRKMVNRLGGGEWTKENYTESLLFMCITIQLCFTRCWESVVHVYHHPAFLHSELAFCWSCPSSHHPLPSPVTEPAGPVMRQGQHCIVSDMAWHGRIWLHTSH